MRGWCPAAQGCWPGCWGCRNGAWRVMKPILELFLHRFRGPLHSGTRAKCTFWPPSQCAATASAASTAGHSTAPGPVEAIAARPEGRDSGVKVLWHAQNEENASRRPRRGKVTICRACRQCPALSSAAPACQNAAMVSGGCRAVRWRAEDSGIVLPWHVQNREKTRSCRLCGRGGGGEPKDRRGARLRAASDPPIV